MLQNDMIFCRVYALIERDGGCKEKARGKERDPGESTSWEWIENDGGQQRVPLFGVILTVKKSTTFNTDFVSKSWHSLVKLYIIRCSIMRSTQICHYENLMTIVQAVKHEKETIRTLGASSYFSTAVR